MCKQFMLLSLFLFVLLSFAGTACAVTMTASFTADNVIDNWWLVDNGTETLLDRTQLGNRGLWETADSVVFDLADGHSYSLIWKARNSGTIDPSYPTRNPAGFLADLDFGSYSLLTSSSWEVSLDGNTWVDAMEYGNNGSTSDPSRIWGEISNISTDAQWIWSAGDFTVDTDSDLYIKASFETAPVPEPATFVLLGSGLAGLAFYRRRRK